MNVDALTPPNTRVQDAVTHQRGTFRAFASGIHDGLVFVVFDGDTEPSLALPENLRVVFS